MQTYSLEDTTFYYFSIVFTGFTSYGIRKRSSFILENALEAVKKAKRRLFEKLADRKIEREEFLERKKGYDAEISGLEQEISDAELAERIAREADGEARERVDVSRSFLNVGEMSEEIWERFVTGAGVPGWED